jgi:hypothetical protein
MAALAESGLSDAAFAQEAGLDPQRLHRWRRRLEGARPALGATRPAAASAFVEVDRSPGLPVRSSTGVEVVLRSGDVVRAGSGTDEATLRMVIAVLRSC